MWRDHWSVYLLFNNRLLKSFRKERMQLIWLVLPGWGHCHNEHLARDHRVLQGMKFRDSLKEKSDDRGQRLASLGHYRLKFWGVEPWRYQLYKDAKWTRTRDTDKNQTGNVVGDCQYKKHAIFLFQNSKEANKLWCVWNWSRRGAALPFA